MGLDRIWRWVPVSRTRLAPVWDEIHLASRDIGAMNRMPLGAGRFLADHSGQIHCAGCTLHP